MADAPSNTPESSNPPESNPESNPESAKASGGEALSMLASKRPRDLGSVPAGAMLFGDWGTSRLYVLGLAFLVAGRTAFWLILMMSVLILAVGWAYTHICRLYPDGGGVYSAGKHRARILGVVCALLLFADYTITASISALEAFHYFGLGSAAVAQVDQPADVKQQAQSGEVEQRTPLKEGIAQTESEVLGGKVEQPAPPTIRIDPGDEVRLPESQGIEGGKPLWTWPPSEGMYAIGAIIAIGLFNLLGPGHTSRYAMVAAGGMIGITLLVVVFAIPQIPWSQLDFGHVFSATNGPFDVWQGFVYIVLALSGVEAIANLTGVMKQPVYRTASRSIWSVAGEVAVFNLLLAIAMVALAVPSDLMPAMVGRESHTEDMLAFMAQVYVGGWGEGLVRIVAGVLLLSATNTAVNGLMSILYAMSRDGEMPGALRRLNGFGSPWVGALVAAGVPAAVLLLFNDLNSLAALYAIGVVAAVAINATLAGLHPRLPGTWQKYGMFVLGGFLALVWVTLAFTKPIAVVFVAIVLTVGLSLRFATKMAAKRRHKPSLLRQAIFQQLTPDALIGPKFMLATAGSTQNADWAIEYAREHKGALVVAFVREVALGPFGPHRRYSLDEDPAAQRMFVEFLEKGRDADVPIIPAYDVGENTAEVIAELAAVNVVDRLLIGSSRRGALHHLVKGSFQQKLEDLLPPEIPVEVVAKSNQN